MMRFSKRDFLRSVAGIGALSAFRPAFASPTGFWEDIRAAYRVTDSFIQLENGYYSLASNEVLEPYLRHIQD
ncbi:MAG: aminotransferase, partial [Siphonobacter aquaeclarae]|nr:aminotransferase [Siphonobacter aquaeclarae]